MSLSPDQEAYNQSQVIDWNIFYASLSDGTINSMLGALNGTGINSETSVWENSGNLLGYVGKTYDDLYNQFTEHLADGDLSDLILAIKSDLDSIGEVIIDGKTLNIGSFNTPGTTDISDFFATPADQFDPLEYKFETPQSIALLHFSRNLIMDDQDISYLELIKNADQYIRIEDAKNEFHKLDNFDLEISGNTYNVKWTSADGLNEYIFQSNFANVDDVVNAGSYNFFAPTTGADGYNHLQLDVFAWIAFGNLYGDISTVNDRGYDGVKSSLPDHITNMLDTTDAVLYENMDLNDEDNVVEFRSGIRFDLAGFAGNDLFHSGEQNDRYDGGDGSDTVSYIHSNTGISVNLRLGQGYDGYAAYDNHFEQLISIENIIGSNQADVIVGSVEDNKLEGMGGNDSIAGEGGEDTLIGGAGDDYIEGGEGTDTAIYAGKYGQYTVSTNDDGSVSVVSRNGADLGTDTLKEIEFLEFADFHVDISNAGSTTGSGIILDENFDDGILNTDGWTYTSTSAGRIGSYVTERNGYLDIQNASTDNGGQAVYELTTPASDVTISFDQLYHNNPSRWYQGDNNFYDPRVRLDFKNEGGETASVDFSLRFNEYLPTNQNNLNYINHPRLIISSEDGTVRSYDTSVTSSTLYDQWLEMEFSFNSSDGSVEIDYAPEPGAEMFTTSKSLVGMNLASVSFHSYGWWTGHYTYIDNLQIVNQDAISNNAFEILDSNNLYSWDSYFDTIDSDGNRSARTINYDDGRVVETTYSNGIQSSRTSNDADNAYAWSAIEQSYDANGVRLEQRNIYDDGRTLVTSFSDGVKSGSSMTDESDTHAWDSYSDIFDAEGVRVSRSVLYDDGRNRDTSYVDGVRSVSETYDVKDAHVWQYQKTTFTSDNNPSQRTIDYDDGKKLVTDYNGGLQSGSIMTDTSNAFSWSTIEKTYLADGKNLDQQTNTYDDGRVLTTDYIGGDKFSQTMTDVSDTHSWESYTDLFYDDNFVFSDTRVERTQIYDDGRELVTGFINGVRAQSVMSDVDDVKSWDTYTIDYDTEGNKISQTMTYDDGREVFTSYVDDFVM